MGVEKRPPQPPIRQFGGMNVRDSEMGLPGNDSPFMVNTDLHPNGSIRMRNGTSALTTPDDETKIDAIMRVSQPEESRGWIYCIADGTIYRTADPGTWAWVEPTMAAGYTLADQRFWGRANARYYDGTTEYKSCLYIPRTNGVPIIALGQTSETNDLIELPAGSYGDGADGTGTLGHPSTWTTNHWPTSMRVIGIGSSVSAVSGGTETVGSGAGTRMHAWGMSDDRNKVYYSELGVPWNFLRSNVDFPALDAQPSIDGGYYYIERGDGDEIVSVVDMFSYTVIFKRHRTFIYTGDPGASDWQQANVYNVGCVSDRAWVKVGNDIIFWAEDGPRSLAAVIEYGDLAQNSLSGKVSTLFGSIVPSSFDRICAYHDISNLRVVWYVPTAAASYNDIAYVYYYGSGKWTKWSGVGCEIIDVATITADTTNAERFVGGTNDNGIVLLQSGFYDVDLSKDDDTDDISQDYYTNWINAGEVSDVARALWLDIISGDEGPQVDIYYQIDLNSEWTQITRVTKSMGGSGTLWGYFNWGESQWGTTSRAMQRYELDAVFNFIRFRFTVTGHYGFEIMGYRPELRMEGPNG